MPASTQARQLKRRTSIFINAPYGPAHQDLFIGYVVGAVSLGLTPRAAIETYDSTASRLERIAALLRGCRYSLHDLSAVALDTHLGVPRFNMPLELGMAIQEQYRTAGPASHRWVAFDAEQYRVDVSTSDLRGYETVNHGGRPEGVLRGIFNNLQSERPVSYPEMFRLYNATLASLPRLFEETGTSDIFSPTTFHRLVSLAADLRQ